MNIPKIEEAITLLYQTYIEEQDVAKQRGIAITAMNEMVRLLGGDDVVAKIEAVPYSARLRAQHLFEDAPQRPSRSDIKPLTDEEAQKIFHSEHCNISKELAGILARAIEAKLKEKNT